MNLRRWFSGLLMLRQGEGRIVLFVAVLAALAGFGLSVGRASSDALFFKRYGVDYLPQMYALIALVLVPASLAYAAFVDRLAPHRMFMHMLAGFGVVTAISWLGMLGGMGNAGIALYFIAYGVISELLLTHFSVYAGSFFDTQQAKRLLPSVMATSRLGATLGGVFLGVTGSGMATEHAAIVWMLCLAATLVLVAWRHRGEPTHSLIKRGCASSPMQMVREGLMFSRQSQLMRVTALGMFLLVLLLSIQEFLVGKIFVRHYPDERELAAFFGWFSAILNASVLLIQLFLSGRLIRRLGLKTMNLVYPVSTLLSFGLLTISTGYLAAIMGRINTDGMLPGFRNPAAGFFFRALPGYMRGRAQALLTGLILPLGLLGAALFLSLVPHDAPLEWVAGGGLVFAAALFWVKLKKNAAYGDSLLELVGQSVFARDAGQVAELAGLDREAAFRLAGLMPQAESLPVLNNYADMLESLAPEHAAAAMLDIYPRLPPKFQDQILLRIARLAPPGWKRVAWEAARHGDPHLAETTARLLLAAGHPAATEQAGEWLEAESPRLRSAAAVGCLHADAPALKAKARDVLEGLLASPHPGDTLAALGALAAMPHEDLLPAILPLLTNEDAKARMLVLKTWSRFPQSSVENALKILDQAMRDPSPLVRATAIRTAAALQIPGMPSLDWLGSAQRDADYRVRRAARECAKSFLPTNREDWLEALAQRETDFDLQNLMLPELASSDIESRASILRQVSERHVRLARDKLMIMENLDPSVESSSHAFQLLRLVLCEEAGRHLDAVLNIQGCLDQSPQMSYIRAGLASRDKQLWAQALESAMQFKKEGRLFRELAILFEAQREGGSLGGEPPGGKGEFMAWLQWCLEYGSVWLAECASYCLDHKNKESVS